MERDGRRAEGRGERRGGRGAGGGRPGRDDHGERRAQLDKLDSAVRDLEKPLTTGDFAAQAAPLSTLATSFATLRLTSLDVLEERLRGRVFTALLRAGRQT